MGGSLIDSFTRNQISVSGGQLMAYSIGKGPAIIFLHGGPGDTHDYMKRMAEPLFRDYQCIFFDQRGTGGSTNFDRKPDQFSLDLLFNDLKAVQDHFKASTATLVGHSWGAMYALYFCIQHPEQFTKVALLNMGPLDSEMEKRTSEHLISVLSESEKEQWTRLRAERNMARDEGNIEKVEALDKELMNLRVKAWVYDPKFRESFLNEYFQDPPPDREVNKWIWEAQQGWFAWDRLSTVQTPTWVCIGANDSVPVSQAQRIVETMPNAQLTVFENCGHIPWMEHSKEFYYRLGRFLKNDEILEDGK